MKKVYVVGDSGPEHNEIRSIHKTYAGALNAWNRLRLELLDRARYYLKNRGKGENEMYEEMVKSLSYKDPEKIDNYPHETPYVHEMNLED